MWTEEKIVELINNNDKMVVKSLMKLYEYQTADEQECGEASWENGVGFNGVDAPIMSSFAEFYKKSGFLSKKQIAIARKKLIKYRKQLVKIANMPKEEG